MNLFYHMLDLLQTDTISLQNGRQNTVYLIKYAYSFVLFFCFCCGNIILIVRCIYPYSLGFIHFQWLPTASEITLWDASKIYLYQTTTHSQYEISNRISNHVLSKVWDEMTYPFAKFKGCRDK